MTQSITIHVSSGKFKGRKLELPSADTTRSSKSIVRASVIDTLQVEILDATFVEVFAGSGSVGIEALSRGAGYAIFCEKDRYAYGCLINNLNSLKIGNAKAYLQDSFLFFDTLVGHAKDIGATAIFYFDPPFDIRDDMSDIYDRTLKLIESLSKEFVMYAIIEARTGINAPQEIGKFKLQKSKIFGKTTLYYYN